MVDEAPQTMTKQLPTFKIRLTTPVTFRDREGNITRALAVGDTLEATCETNSYFVTSLGGIYKDEAKRID
jgi:hypothetical protein